MSVILNSSHKEDKQEVNLISSKHFTINDLSKDLILKIFDYLSLQTLASCAQVCKKWKATLGSHGDKLFLKFFKGVTLKEKLQNYMVGQKALTDIPKLQEANESFNKKKLILRIAIIVSLFLIVAAAIAITVLTCGGGVPVIAVTGGGLLFLLVGTGAMNKLLS